MYTWVAKDASVAPCALSFKKVLIPLALGGITFTSLTAYCAGRKHKWTLESTGKDLKEYGGKGVSSYFKPISVVAKKLHEVAQDVKEKLVDFTAKEERATKALSKELDQARRLQEFREVQNAENASKRSRKTDDPIRDYFLLYCMHLS
jgi:hypothetical protein